MNSERRTAIITGGAQGIGRATAHRLAEEGYFVAIADLLDKGRDVATEIRDLGGSAIFIPTDVSVGTQVQTLVEETLRETGRIDALVACAGVIGSSHSLLELPIEEYRRVMEINLTGTLLCCQAVLPAMLASRWGRIVVLTSNARHGAADQAHYAISKAGVVALVRSMAYGYAREGVLANCVDPGQVVTEMIVGRYSPEYIADPPGVSIGRLAQPREIAELVAYLCSERNTYTVGSVVEATGALHIG